jgi:hypothetical protein
MMVPDATVTAGLRSAPLKGAEQNAPTKTARPQPAMMTIQPALFPFVIASTTLGDHTISKDDEQGRADALGEKSHSCFLHRVVRGDGLELGKLRPLPRFVATQLLREQAGDRGGHVECRLTVEKERARAPGEHVLDGACEFLARGPDDLRTDDRQRRVQAFAERGLLADEFADRQRVCAVNREVANCSACR